MIASAELSSRRRGQGVSIATGKWAYAKVVLSALAVLILLAQPADARKKRTRSFYAPPQAAMVVDGYSGKIIYSSNPDEPRYPASITKVMTLYMLFEEMKDGKLSLDSKLKVTSFAASQSPSKLGLEPGSTITVKDAIYALVTKSANDCAVVVAENLAGSEEAFARAMTAKARSLGMTNTTFRNASGLPNTEQRTTARDLITMGRRILADFPEHADVFSTRVFTYSGESHRNHNGLLFTYKGTEGLKTGFTQASGFNLLSSARRDNKHLMAVVLGGRSAVERNSRMRSLLNASWDNAIEGSKALIAKGRIAPMAPAPAPAPAPAAAPEVEVASAGFEMPERNPAFHPTDSERAMTGAMAAMLDMDRRHAETVQAATMTDAGGIAVASTEPVAMPAAAAVALPEEEQVAREELVSAAEEMSDEAGGIQEEGDTTANTPAPPPAPVLGPYHIQVGSYASELGAKTWAETVASGKAKDIVNGHGLLTVQGEVSGQPRYRSRFGQFSEKDATAACRKLKALSIDCMIVRVE
jgi:D-alanyl-D-alanine carboxypeptidase